MRPAHITESRYEYLVRMVQSHDSDECLMWPFDRTSDGYGYLLSPTEKKKVVAHRLAFRVAYGRLPEPLGCHSCDNPPCFNPRHIFEGSNLDNHKDAAVKGRRPRQDGEHNGNSVLTPEMVTRLRAEHIRYSRTNSFRALAEKYGVSLSAVAQAVEARHWKNI